MHLDFLFKVFAQSLDAEAIIWRNKTFTYGWLLDRTRKWEAYLEDAGVTPGMVVALEADFSPTSVALFLALTEKACIQVPLTKAVETKKDEFKAIAECEAVIRIDDGDTFELEKTAVKAKHPLIQRLRDSGHPGLIVFSSGSTGASKAPIHDMCVILEKFKVRRHARRAITFLLFDHLGGINTLLYLLSNGGCVVTVQDRSPDAVLNAVQRHGVELLPASPTFLNLILLSEAYKKFDLSTLKVITYGTEPMQEVVLKRFHALLPDVRLQQTYGLSELGVLRSKSKSSDTLWVKVGGEDFETRIVDDVLHIKARSAMLGYLNHPNPFTPDGWFNTGDIVDVDGEYVRFRGRKSEIINVGGAKVHPAEVESVLQEIEEVAAAAVYGANNPITGNMVCADIQVKNGAEKKDLVRKIKKYCISRLQSYQVPVKVRFVQEDLHSERFKIIRR